MRYVGKEVQQTYLANVGNHGLGLEPHIQEINSTWVRE
jgi:hypothetical protein